MVNNMSNDINKVLEKVIDEINRGKDKIFNIVNNLSDEFELKKLELNYIMTKLNSVIEEVDELEIEDKKMRKELVDISTKNKSEYEIKKIYDYAFEVRVKYITKQNEEKDLRDRRDKLELSLKKQVENIEEADSTMNQINIALGYIQGNVKGSMEDSEFSKELKILEAQEDERARMAREIHDGPAQNLANALIRIDLCKLIIKRDVEDGVKALEDLKTNVKDALREVRGIIFDLKPIALKELGLKESLKDMIETISEEDKIKIVLEMEEVNSKIDGRLQIGIYRIIQELLNNIRKHSKATEVKIKIDIGKDFIYFYVHDNGIGFNLEEALNNNKDRKKRYGLRGLLDRVKNLQGEIQVFSDENKGTTIKTKLPIR